MKKEVLELAQEFLKSSSSDAVGLAILNFKTHSFEHFELSNDLENPNVDRDEIYFDLASLTKPLVNSFNFISEKLTDPTLELLLNHRGGIPAWGLLQKDAWREQILNYKITESETLYSDYSALRFMLEFEKLTGKKLEDIYQKNLDENIIFWKNLRDQKVLQYGFYNNQPNFGRVHDPNASNLDTFTSHAGLFGTTSGLARTLIEFNKKHDLLSKFKNKPPHRFHYGFDTVENPSQTLAGPGCSPTTFGHLGFTGTSFWIDPVRQAGHVILSNATKYYWYDKKELNILRESFGSMVWKNYTP